MKEGFTFHHLGVACRDIDTESRSWQSIGYEPESDVFEDPVQHVRGRFFVGPGPRVELLQPLHGSVVLKPFLDRGVKVYHHAFETLEIEAAIDALCADGAKMVVDSVSGVAFGGRRTCFLMLPNLHLIELIARDSSGDR